VVRCHIRPASVVCVDRPTRSQLLGTAAIGLVIVVLGAMWARGGGGAPDATGTATTIAAPTTLAVDDTGARAATIVVHVAGAVRRPGVYRLRDGTRVDAAIRRAGGPTRAANLDALNLAAKLADGRQVLVPSRAPAAASNAGSGAAGADAASGVPVNLNSATVEELDGLDGIGPTTAQKIVDYREAHGGFSSVDELDAVPDVGPATIEAIRDSVTV
jgi:competence protein ComEA